MRRLTLLLASAGAFAGLAPSPSAAQGRGAEGKASENLVVPTETGNVVIAPDTMVTDVYVPPPSPSAPGADSSAGLPSSSRPITNTSSSGDGFDLNPTSSGPVTVRGRAGSAAVLEQDPESSARPATLPTLHTVRRGDTLWDLCARYFGNPWAWPKLWSYNPQIQNPHWIYPGDQVRLASADRDALRAGTSQSLGPGRSSRQISAGTILLRNVAILDDPGEDVFGELVGSREEQMLLGEGNHVYLQIRPGAQVSPGQKLTLFGSGRRVEAVAGARRPRGQIVPVKGTVRIDQFNPRTRVARGEIIESVDVVERGNKLGSVSRSLDVVPPRPSRTNLRARVLTSLYPHVFLSEHQIVFLDRGTKDGLEPGNRLFVVRRGDPWRHSLKDASALARERVRMNAPKPVEVETTPLRGDERRFPDEIIAELRVLRTNELSSVALVTDSHQEVVSGDRAEARKGY